jgi:hypothetical protein
LHFDDNEWLGVSVREAMEVSCGDMTSLILMEELNLFIFLKFSRSDIDGRDP